MSDEASLMATLEEVLAIVGRVDPRDPEAARAALEAALPLDGPLMTTLRERVRAGVRDGALAAREQGGIRFGRVRKAGGEGELSIDCVHMDRAGPGHTHPSGEIDLAFAVSGSPTFDGRAPGWTVYPPGSWHVPTVEGGAMDILYFLPGGAIRFEAQPS